MTHRCSDCEGHGQNPEKSTSPKEDLMHTVPVGDIGDGYVPDLPLYPFGAGMLECEMELESDPIMAIYAHWLGTCKACGAEIIWIKTSAGRSMPCDPTPICYTTHVPKDQLDHLLVLNNGVVIACKLVDGPEGAEGVGYNPHWDTCPHVEQFRHKGGRE